MFGLRQLPPLFISLLFLGCFIQSLDAYYYWRYPHSEVIGVSERRFVTAEEFFGPPDNSDSYSSSKQQRLYNIAELEKLCSSVRVCRGFTSDGYVITVDINDKTINSSHTRELYVKKEEPAATDPNIWPLPQKFLFGQVTLQVSPNFAFALSPTFLDLTKVVSWVTDFSFQHTNKGGSGGITFSSLKVSVTNTSAPLQLGVDESYILTIPADGSAGLLTANTLYGAINGLQTFSQLLYYNFTSQSYQILGAPVNIQDFPRYSHRGLLMDTSRHFQPISIVKKVVDSLSFAKLNVLHWHMVDSQSFPFESKSSPKFWNGAYSEYEKYTQDDVAEVVEYARIRNVRVMVEFDTPGHAASWCRGYPEICPSPSCLEPLNPATEQTFTVLQNLFSELTGNAPGKGLFPDAMIHLGGDEVNTACWTSTPSIVAWMQKNKFTADEAYFYFVNRVLNIVINQGRDPVNWEEVYNHFGTNLNKRAIVHAWFNKATVKKAVSDGYRSLNSDRWYLDHLNDLWTDYYNNDPMENINDPSQQKLVLGGETCMWGETVDPSDIFNTVWPRAAAVAERLWSAASVTNTVSALPRYEFFRCLLTRRGINAAPSLNKVARQPPPNPGSCFSQ